MYPADKVLASRTTTFRSIPSISATSTSATKCSRPSLAPTHAVQVHRREYYAILSHMDAQIGRIFDALERSGKADNTYVIMTADHGLCVGEHGLHRQAERL